MKYNFKTNIPQYVPKEKVPKISELYDLTKYNELIKNINEADISAEEKKFLKAAACRHVVFKYDKIADYYASAPPSMQTLMEESALVIIDINDAIANGYVKLNKRMAEIIGTEIGDKDEE